MVHEKMFLVLQHRDELVNQNISKFKRINPNISTSVVNAEQKDWNGDAVFSMVQTLSRPNNLDNMKAMDMVVVDESHHVVADTYTRIINHAKEINDKVEIVGFTATPNRGDKKVYVKYSPIVLIKSRYQHSFVKVSLSPQKPTSSMWVYALNFKMFGKQWSILIWIK